ncbi:uncharacterized protein LOC109727994 [Ananas comosus]|uniref:YTH domain-containing family protein n=1 Tax=Ananas comosus TaxID=4615 RepID=A0A6P5GYR6_ANACO|nr:uncharacterized protein LOC109727994 [Ananas comosus]
MHQDTTSKEIGFSGSEVAPEVIYGQDLYYPPNTDYYGYYSTGAEAPGAWDDHQSVFVSDGQDLHYVGPQAEGSPYVYYAPNYGYPQSHYNPYNPYMPSSVVGPDGSIIGMQQYLTNPAYHQQITSPSYFPVIPTGTEFVPHGTSDQSLYSGFTSVPSKADAEGMKNSAPLVSATAPVDSQRASLLNPTLEHSFSSSQQFQLPSNGSLLNLAPRKQSATQLGSQQATQFLAGNSSGPVHATEQFFNRRIPSFEPSSKVEFPMNNSLMHFGSNSRKFIPNDKMKPADSAGRPHSFSTTANRVRDQPTSSITVKSYTSKLTIANPQGIIVIKTDQYNRDDFPVEYPYAKFFIIKSYSEDDVHKSIKYNVWSSTPNGNKKLDAAYEDAQRLSALKGVNCPVFLFFSVNGSGRFCGVAEMLGRVDFQRDMDFWQQDKWSGSFSVKWHIIKDVPNTNFRQITLENNENKPVTHSRDTQEVMYIPGTTMLKIFKSSLLRESILDDFPKYEELEKSNKERRFRLLRSHDAPLFTPTLATQRVVTASPKKHPSSDHTLEIDIPNRPQSADEKRQDGNFDQTPQSDDNQSASHAGRSSGENREQPNVTAERLPEAEEKQQNAAAVENPKADGVDQLRTEDGDKSKSTTAVRPSNKNKEPRVDGKQSNDTVVKLAKEDNAVDQSRKPEGKKRNGVTYRQVKVLSPPNSKPVDLGPDGRGGSDPAQVVGNLAGEVSSLSISSSVSEEADSSSFSGDVVKIGSMHIRVQKTGEST